MLELWQESGFFSWELFNFMILFYAVWVPGFLLAGLLTCRYRYLARNSLVAYSRLNLSGLFRAVELGVVGSAGRKTSINAMRELLSRGVPLPLGFAFLIASRNMTIHFWAIFALSLGAEFATGQVLGALIMIGIVTLGVHWLNIRFVGESRLERQQGGLFVETPNLLSWRALLFSLAGWQAILRFTWREVGSFAPSLVIGILIGGIILAAGLHPWWPTFADVFGHATLLSDLTNAIVGGALSIAFSLSPVGNLPVIHALFKTDGLGYPGVISFCLASAIHRSDIKTYLKTFGRRQGCALVSLLYGAAVLGGLGSTWIYAAFGFRPALPPVRLAGNLARDILGLLGF